MRLSEPCVVLTRDGASKIAGAPIRQGHLRLRHTPAETNYVIDVVEVAENVRHQVDIPPQYVALRSGDEHLAGQWMRSPQEGLNIWHLWVLRRPGAVISYEAFREKVPGVDDPGNKTGFLITYEPGLATDMLEAGATTFAGWLVARDGVRPIHIDREPEVIGIDQLKDRWPIELLAGNSVMLVGCGSIGAAAAEALAGYGVGALHLVDPDRLLWHNMLRHTLGPESVGMHKVDALQARHARLWPSQLVVTHPIDVVSDADFIRPIIGSVDLVLCAADGIAPRRVVSHLARRAGKPAVLGCVLDQGSVGEILRLRPTPRFGCLLCMRQSLVEAGAMDAEADQELAYGTGQSHRPMTAVPPDLQVVGTLAAKVAVATILESLHGDHTQQLPGEHAIVGLRPAGDLSAPFDVRFAGEVRWLQIPPPRSACPTCGPA